MFINITEFKKLLKAAYKGSGLIVGNLDGGLIVTNVAGLWGVRVDCDFLPNKLKAALIELIGDLPEDGEVCSYQTDCVQTEADLGRFDYLGRWKQAKDYAVQTPFILTTKWNEFVMMQVHSSMELRPIARLYVDLISTKDLDHQNESMPGNPSYARGTLYWKNGTMIYWAGTSILNDDLEEKVIPRLAFLDCFKNEIILRDGENLPFDEEE